VASNKFSREDIHQHYSDEARKHGVDGASTIQDTRTRNLELKAITSYLRDGARVLEVGCGNGFFAIKMIEKFKIELDAFDFSEDLIGLAKQQAIGVAQGSVSFEVGDILNYNKNSEFDIVYSVRCIQNLVDWEEQKVALSNIIASIKVGGQYIMNESFDTGLNNLNEARAELELPRIEAPWHNTFFHEAKTIEYVESLGCSYVDQNAYLSGYYFGSRVILPALAPKNKKISSSSRLNDYFCALPPAGDFCPTKIIRFRRER
jgi:ubiquinone/menaquinone biosynthesis C-methylase UbiE